MKEELKIVRLFNSLVVDTELETYEHQLNKKLEKFKEQKKEIAQEIQHLKKSLEAFKEEHDILSAEDKSQDKAFIREFSDVSPGVREQLLKLFKKRAKYLYLLDFNIEFLFKINKIKDKEFQ